MPYTSHGLVPPTFQSPEQKLETGVHLHWRLPPALTRSWAFGDQPADFPAVPNRWLVTRFVDEKVAARWVVESDYLHPRKSDTAPGHSNIPWLVDAECPYRFLGRAMAFDDWQRDGESGDYWRDDNGVSQLNAVGYGEPTFAAYYPNCRTVFGFCDSGVDTGALAKTRYEVAGWYSDRRDSFLANYLMAKRDPNLALGHVDRSEALSKTLRQELGWSLSAIDDLDETQVLDLVCQGSSRLDPKGQPVSQQIDAVSLAQTGVEALGALLAHDITPKSRPQSEAVLDAILLDSELRDHRLDMGPQFHALRHANAFNGVAAGTAWSVEVVASDEQAKPTAGSEALPPQLAGLLNELSRAQGAYDTAQHDLITLGRQLFGDWYQYQLAMYPVEDDTESPDWEPLDPTEYGREDPGDYDGYTGENASPDDIRAMIEKFGIPELKELSKRTGQMDPTGCFAKGEGDTLAHKLADAIAAVSKALDELNKDALQDADQAAANAPQPVTFRLVQQSAPRFWQAKDPVVLLSGEGVQTSHPDMRDAEGHLPCAFWPDGGDVGAAFKAGQTVPQVAQIATQTGKPWTPFILEWQAAFIPVENGDKFDARYVTAHYKLTEGAVDLAPRKAFSGTIKTDLGDEELVSRRMSGTTILTGQSARVMQTHLERYFHYAILRDLKTHLANLPDPEFPSDAELKSRILAQCVSGYDPAEVPPDLQYSKEISQIIDAYQFHATTPELGYAQAAYTRVMSEGFHAVSQSLGGFNEALLLQNQILHMPVSDPRDEASELADMLTDLIGENTSTAPRPNNVFTPIRAGVLSLEQLRLIDSFGQVLFLPNSSRQIQNMITPDLIETHLDQANFIRTPPRIVQPARLNFRWLDGHPDADPVQDLNKAGSVITGWVVPNLLDQSLAIYDAHGVSLGAIVGKDHIAASGCWTPAVGASGLAAAGDIKNPHLKRMVLEIISVIKANTSGGFLDRFLKTLEVSLEQIDPESFAEHKSMAMLCGRPMAVVRAAVSLELQGRPAVNRNAAAFMKDVDNASINTQAVPRTTDGFTRVRYPLRLGEFHRFNDGLVGYWCEDHHGSEVRFRDRTFYAPQSSAAPTAFIKTAGDNLEAGPINLEISLDDPAPQVVTMLIDPRGLVHATTGILPSKAISLPPEHYADALEAIEVTFEVFPILTESRQLHLPLSDQAEGQWAWMQKQGETWVEISSDEKADDHIRRTSPEAKFYEDQNLKDGWLVLRKPKTAAK